MEEKKSTSQAEVNLVIDEIVDNKKFAFVGAEYKETISGILPTLKADFICETDKFPLYLTEINMTLTVNEHEWRLIGTLDDFKFNENVVSLYITLAPRDFYIKVTNDKFLSIDDVIRRLYPGEVVSDIKDTLPREINQVGTTDYKILNNVLRGMRAPCAFSYNLNRLRIKDLSNPTIDLSIDPDERSYYVHERMKNYTFYKGAFAEATTYTVMDKDGKKETSLTEYDGAKVHHNTSFDDMIENVIESTKYLKQNRLKLRVLFQYIPDAQSGDIIRIDIPNIDQTRFLVTERLGIIGKEIKFAYLLREI